MIDTLPLRRRRRKEEMMIDTLQPRRWMLQEAPVYFLNPAEEGEKRGDGDPAPPKKGRKEERCKFCGGTPRVLNHPKNWHRKPTDHDVLVQAPTVKVEPLDPTPPGPPASERRVDRRGSYRSDRDAVGHFTGNFAGYDATGNFAGYDATGNFAGYDATGYFAGSFTEYDTAGYFAGCPSRNRNRSRNHCSSPAVGGEKRGEKRRWWSPCSRSLC